MDKSDLIKYINENYDGPRGGRKEFQMNDIFISSTNHNRHYRLTTYGKDILSRIFTPYQVVLEKKIKTFTGNQVLTIEKYMKSPYYIKNGNMIVFEEVIAAELAILNNDIDLWLEGKSFYEK